MPTFGRLSTSRASHPYRLRVSFVRAVCEPRHGSVLTAACAAQSVQAASALYPPPAVAEPPSSQPSEGAITAREPSTDSTTSARASVTSLAASPGQPAAVADISRPDTPTASKASATSEKPRPLHQSSVAEATALGQEIARLSKVIHQLKNAAPASPQELASSNGPSPTQRLTRAHVIMVTILFLCFGLALPLLFDPLALRLPAPMPA